MVRAGEPDNKLGALPYDTYILEESPAPPMPEKIWQFWSSLSPRNNFTVNLGSICNYTVELHTEAKDTATGTKTVAPSAEASVTDTVTYRNLTVGRQYRITGQLILKETENRWYQTEFRLSLKQNLCRSHGTELLKWYFILMLQI